MATANNTSKRQNHNIVSRAFHLPTLALRIDGNTYPKHLEVGVSFGDEISMHFHTAGKDVIWEIPVAEAAKNQRLINGLSPDDALQVGIYWQEQISKSHLKSLNLEIDRLNSQLKHSIVKNDRLSAGVTNHA